MNKAEVVRLVAARLGMSRRQVQCDLDAWLGAIQAAVLRGERVEIRDFGVFMLRDTKPPSYGAMKLPVRRLPKFMASRRVVGALNGHKPRVGGMRPRGKLR